MSDHKETDSKKSLSAEDASLWRELTKDVNRLPGKNYIDSEEETETKEHAPRDSVKIHRQSVVDEHKAKKTGKDVDRATLKRFQRGEIAIEAKIDLHGMNQGQARDALVNFIRNAYVAGQRCVLVVTGKGNTGRQSEDWLERKPGVLKRRVPEWLNEAELNSIVLQTAKAQPKHGGDGALYVYLRRKR